MRTSVPSLSSEVVPVSINFLWVPASSISSPSGLLKIQPLMLWWECSTSITTAVVTPTAATMPTVAAMISPSLGPMLKLRQLGSFGPQHPESSKEKVATDIVRAMLCIGAPLFGFWGGAEHYATRETIQHCA